MLDVDGLRKVYDGQGRRVEALAGLTFRATAGEFVCVVGPSGCGKTTLLRCIAGLLAPSGGTVRVDGEPVTGPPPDLAIVFQEYGRSLFPWLRVHENVELPLRAKGLPKAERHRLVAGALAEVHRLVDVVGDEEEGHAEVAPDLADQVLQVGPGLRVDGGERLVHQQHAGLVRDGTRDGHPLLHTAGELPGVCAVGVGQSDGTQRLRDEALS